jgi:lysophospholipase L1-like esterase
MIVFLGDSITQDADWKRAFPDQPVDNHGISGETSWEVLRRVPAVTRLRPAVVFLLVGTNDLGHGGSPADTAATIGAILERLAVVPTVYVESVLPRERHNAGWVRGVNSRLEGIATRHGTTYLDLFPEFADERDALRAELTYDGVHLSDAGYDLWYDLLRPCVAGGSPPR